MAKFVEKDYEKIVRLIRLRREFAMRVQQVDTEIKGERTQLNEEEAAAKADEWFSRRLDAGLYCVQVELTVLDVHPSCMLTATDDRCYSCLACRRG